MEITCKNNNHFFNNHISCCLTYLLNSKYHYDSTFQTIAYATFLLRSLTHCNKILPLSTLFIPYSSLISLLDAITHCASLFYFYAHYPYGKFLILIGLQISNSTTDKGTKDIKKRKTALFNIISCIYLKEGKYAKAIKFAKKSLSYSQSKMDKAIAYNNLAIISYGILSNKQTFHSCISPVQVIENIELSQSKIADKLAKDYANKSKKESIALILLNYISILESIKDQEKQREIDRLIKKGYEYSHRAIGDNNYIAQCFYNKMTKKSNSILETPQKAPEKIETEADMPIITISSEKQLPPSDSKKEEEEETPKTNFDINNSTIRPFLLTTHISNNLSDFFLKKSESTPSTVIPIADPKSIKETQNYFFGLDHKPKQTKIAMMSLFTPPQINQTIGSPTSINSPTPKANPFDELMKRLASNGSLLTAKDLNSTYKSVEPIPKIIVSHKKRNTLQFSKNPNESLIEVRSAFCTQNLNKKATEIIQELIITYDEEFSKYTQYIEHCLNYEQYDISSNYYRTKYINDNYAEDYLRTLLASPEKFLHSNDTFCIKYIKNKEDYSIYIKNNTEKSSFQITISLDNIDKQIEEEYSYGNLSKEINQIFFWNSMPIHCNINFITNTSMLIEQILIHHFQLLKSPSATELSQVGILSHPVPFPFMLFEFEFFNTVCRCHFHIRKYYIILLIVSSADESVYLRFNITMDDSSFNILFKQNSFTPKQNIPNVVLIPAYSPLSPDLARSFLIDFLIKLQEIIKHTFSSPPSTFNDLVQLSQKSIFKIIFEDSLEKKELYVLSYKSDKIKWTIDYYSISIIEISNSSLYMHRSLELNAVDFINVIGADPSDVINKMSRKNIIITHSILLNKVKLRNIMTKFLTEENYDTIIRLVKLKPVSLFLLKTVISHMRRFYCCSIEFLVYSNELYFIRIIAMESSICRTYVKIYLPYFLVCASTNMDSVKLEIEEKYSCIKKGDRGRIRRVLKEEVMSLLCKNERLNMYDNINVLLSKLNGEKKA